MVCLCIKQTSVGINSVNFHLTTSLYGRCLFRRCSSLSICPGSLCFSNSSLSDLHSASVLTHRQNSHNYPHLQSRSAISVTDFAKYFTLRQLIGRFEETFNKI